MKFSGSFHSKRRPAMRGVTLIELMVGMVIGLLAILVMVQVGVVFENHKRTTTSGSDAQVNAALALYTLERDVKMGGFGLTSAPGAAGCPIKGHRAGAGGGPRTMVLAPVFITDGASGAPDSIEVAMSSNPNFSVPMLVVQRHMQDENEFVLEANINLGSSLGDLMLAVPDVIDSERWCSLFNISTDPATTENRIVHDPGSSGPWNQDAATTVFPKPSNQESYPAGSYLINLGRLTNRVYSVNTTKHALEVLAIASDATISPTEELFPNVVSLQAVYGKDTNADLTPDVWNAVQPANAAEWSQVIAVRMAVVTRSAQYEAGEAGERGAVPTAVTTTLPTWKPDGVTATGIKVDTLADWAQYRYKVYEMTVPLRNVLWASSK